MGITSIKTEFAGQVGVTPRLARIESSDTFNVVTSAGYISNQSSPLIQSLEDKDFVFVSYSGGSGIFNVISVDGEFILYPSDELPLAQVTVSDPVPSIIFNNLSSDYSSYEFNLANIVPETNDAELNVRFSTDNGATFLEGAGDYNHIRLGISFSQTLSGGNAADSRILALPEVENNTSPMAGVAGKFTLSDPNNSDLVTSLSWDDCVYIGITSILHKYEGAAISNNLIAVNAIQFYFSTGNIDKGEILMHGKKRP